MAMCNQCVTSDNFPGIVLNEKGVCNKCTLEKSQPLHKDTIADSKFESIKKTLHTFKRLKRDYDVVVPLSGGVDSSFALIELVTKYNLKVL